MRRSRLENLLLKLDRGGVIVELVQHELRLHADPARVVVRPFHLAWQASGPDLERVQKLARKIFALDTRTVRAELSVVLRDFADRHWQIEKVFEERFNEIEPRLYRYPAIHAPSFRRAVEETVRKLDSWQGEARN